MANLIFSILSEYNGKGLAKGKKDLTAFEKQTKQLGKTFAKYLGAAALVKFGKNAVMAFAADEKAAKSLELQLKNTGYAFSSPDVEYYIANLQKLYGVLDDELRPAFQTLLTASESITKSQQALSTALNVSAATGKSVQEVSAALAKGYSGQTTALTRLGAGLSKATLASGNMDKIMAELDAKFAGQASARLDTYAGKMDQLKVATANASETIGKGLLDALGKLSGDTTLVTLTSQIEGLAGAVAKLVSGIGRFTGTLVPGNVVKVNGEWRLKSEMSKSNFTYSLGSGAGSELAKIQEKKKIKEAISLRTQENALLKKKTAVDELRDKFDLERIGLTAALNSATDAETKLRLNAQLAILNNNEALAKKYNAELGAVAAANALATSATTAAGALNFLANGMPALFNSLGELTGRGRNQIAPDEFARLPQGVTNMGAQTAATAAATQQTTATLTLDPNASSDKLVSAIGELVRVNLKYGNKLVPAGTIQ